MAVVKTTLRTTGPRCRQLKLTDTTLLQLSLGKRCARPGIVLHEVMHALGFWHEHSRHDRDKFVKVLFKNIKESK